MLLLTAPFDRAGSPAAALPWSATGQAMAGTLGLAAVGLVIDQGGGVLAPFGRPLLSAAVHAGFLATGCAAAMGGSAGWRRSASRLAAVVVIASLMSRATPWGAISFLALPIVLFFDFARRPAAPLVGLAWPTPAAAALGLAAGLSLGTHLLIASSRTFGYAIQIDGWPHYLVAVAYDIGVSAVSAEWLFRGALFGRWWRRWSFGPAAVLATACAVTRYVLDPNLPQTVDARLGAIFYMGLLGLTGCGLRAWSGSLVPGYLATVGFFVLYRALSSR